MVSLSVCLSVCLSQSVYEMKRHAIAGAATVTLLCHAHIHTERNAPLVHQPNLKRLLFWVWTSHWLEHFHYMHHLTCGINSLLHSVNLIVFTLLLAHLILRISPHHSHHLHFHHLSLPRPFTPDLKLISFTNPFLHSHSYSFRTDFTDLNLYYIKGALALFVLVSFSGYVC